jgi:hypothetical protein
MNTNGELDLASAAGKTMEFDNGTTFNGGGPVKLVSGVLTIPGTVSIPNFENDSAGTLTGAGTLNITLTGLWLGGAWTGGGITHIYPNATFYINDGPAGGITVQRKLQNDGVISWSKGDLNLDTGSDITNNQGATFTATGDYSLKNVAAAGQPKATLTNAGTFQKTVGVGVTKVDLPLTDTGTLNAGKGTLYFVQDILQAAGQTTLTGGNLKTDGKFTIAARSSLTGAGTLTATEVINSGTISLGTVTGTLTITGNYTQTGTGWLNLRINGPQAGTGYDQINISGTAKLAGTMAVVKLSSYIPPSGTTFQLLTFGSLDGTSNRFTTEYLPPGWLSIYNTTNYTLTDV